MKRLTVDETDIEVRMVSMGRGVQKFVREKGITVGDFLDQMGVDQTMDFRVNGALSERSRSLEHGDQVLIVPKIKGG
ncbi:MAG: MoaD/ThiS family protein [Nitrospinae bacterium]|nr:MoaD/ThiS family protein [Nitrospinota bacterium]